MKYLLPNIIYNLFVPNYIIIIMYLLLLSLIILLIIKQIIFVFFFVVNINASKLKLFEKFLNF